MWIIAFLVIILSYLWFKNEFRYFKNLGFPYVKPTFPFGSSIKIGSKEYMGDFIKREYDNFKNKGVAFGIYIFTLKILIPTDLNLIKKILVENFECFFERGNDLDFNVDPLLENVGCLGGQKWKNHRQQVSPIFSSGKMKDMFPKVSSTADRMIDFLGTITEQSEDVNLLDITNAFATENIVNLLFSYETKCFGVTNNEFFRLIHDFFIPSFKRKIKRLFQVAYPKLASILKLSFNSREVNEFFFKFVADIMEHRKRNKDQQDDFLQHLINQMNKNELSFDKVVANCYFLLLTGFETTSSIISFCAYELALNPIIQDRLRDEIEETLISHNGEVTYNAIMEMKYLEMVIKETIRKYPIADVQLRRCTKSFKIPDTNLIIPAKTLIMIPAYGLHKNDQYFENPEKFDPERFNEENVKKIHPFAYLPFSKGPRICIGYRLGKMKIKLGLVKLLQNFKVFPCNRTLIPIQFCPNAQTQTPLGGIWLRLKKIHKEKYEEA